MPDPQNPPIATQSRELAYAPVVERRDAHAPYRKAVNSDLPIIRSPLPV